MKKTPAAPSTPGTLRRRLTSALLVLGLTVGTMAITTTSAAAASVVVTCYRALGSNFQLSGLKVRLLVRLPNGTGVADEGVLGANGCATFSVHPFYRSYPLQTVISYMDTGRFSGGYYDGRSYFAMAYYSQYSTWLDYGTGTNGFAMPGQELWYLEGMVGCSGCHW